MAPIFVGSNDDNSRVRSNRVGFAISTSNPGSASEGDAYYNSTDNQLNIYDGSAWASAGAGGNSAEFTASGSISNGQPVVVTSDGKLAGVATVSIAQTIGETVTWKNARTEFTDTVYDTYNNKVVFVYTDGSDSSKGKAAVGTIGAGGTTISFGAETIFHQTGVGYISAVFDESQNKVVIFFRDNNPSDGKFVVGNVVGTAMTFGSATQFSSTNVLVPDAVYAPNAQKVAVFYREWNSDSYGKAKIMTINADNTATVGASNPTFNNATTSKIAASYDPINEAILILYRHSNESMYYRVAIAKPDNTLLFNTEEERRLIHSGNSSQYEVVYEPYQKKHVVIYEDESNNYKGAAKVIGLSTAIVGGSFEANAEYGEKVFFTTGGFGRHRVVYDSSAQKIVDAFRDGTNGNTGTVVVGTVTGFGITFGSLTEYSPSNSTEYNAAVYSPDAEVSVLTGSRSASDNNYAGPTFSRTFVPANINTNLKENNFVGFSDAAYSDGASAKAQIAGSVDDAQSGLTPGKKHYVQRDGSLGITTAIPQVEAGVGISTTQIIVKG